jgi:NAD(P)-dependent dehydrogenase (short-subunit alcohol dehydrogenase family)
MKDRTALVTGGSRGIGRAVAMRLADDGFRVVALARDRLALQRLDEECRDRGSGVDRVVCDLTDAEAVVEILADIGHVDVLVHAAGIASSAPFVRTTLDETRRLLELNVLAPLLVTQQLVGGMQARGWGRVIFIGSVSSLVGLPYTAAYSVSKHAVVGLTRVLAAEFATAGVTANAVCPTYVRTEMTRKSVDRIAEATGLSPSEATRHLTDGSRLGRLLEPTEVAAVVAWLSSEEAGAVNGQVHVIDGGDLQY